MSRPPTTENGGLSEADQARITDLANGRRTAAEIARKLDKNRTSVWWFMLRSGLPMPAQAPVTRATDKPMANGKKLYGPDEDRRMLELSDAGHTYREIAALLSAEFGHPRKRHGVKLRLIRLHALEDA